MFRLFRQRARTAPAIDQRIAGALDDRELMRLALEAMRMQRPDLAHVAYWKAIHIYVSQQQPIKTLAVLNAILRFAPNDGNAQVMRIQTLEQIGRRRDAAVACREAASLFTAYGDQPRAEWCLARAAELDPAPLPAIYPPVPIVVGKPSKEIWSPLL